MEFGKVESAQLNRIDLSLPADDPRTWAALKKASGRPLRVGVGAPVWGVKEWVGKVYPLGTQPKDFLEHYSRQFNSIELNTTHYRTPDADTVRRWRETTPPGFKFNVKFLQEISHRRPLWSRESVTKEFVENVLKLEDRLGLCFLQLPPAFAPQDIPDLKRFLAQLPLELPVAVELRHHGFFRDHRLSAPVYDALADAGAHVVITDVAGRRDVLHTSLTSGRALVRFIGNDLHPSDDARIADWVARLHTWIELGLEQVEFFLHQPGNIRSPESIDRFIRRLNDACHLNLGTWTPMNQGEQLGLF